MVAPARHDDFLRLDRLLAVTQAVMRIACQYWADGARSLSG